VEKVRARATGSSEVDASAPLPLLSITVLRAGMAAVEGSTGSALLHRAQGGWAVCVSAQRRAKTAGLRVQRTHRNAVSSANTSRACLRELFAPFFFVCVGSLVLAVLVVGQSAGGGQ
jgi:hypothetical protein